MDNRVRIGFDLDGVIIDHRAHKLQQAAHFGYPLEPWQANTNFMATFMPKETYHAIQDNLYGELTLASPPVVGALETLANLDAAFYIVAARTPANIRYAQDWLNKYRVFDLIPADQIFFCGTSEDKRTYCEMLHLHAFMDDKLAVLESLPAGVARVLYDEDAVAEKLNPTSDILVATSWPAFKKMAEGE